MHALFYFYICVTFAPTAVLAAYKALPPVDKGSVIPSGCIFQLCVGKRYFILFIGSFTAIINLFHYRIAFRSLRPSGFPALYSTAVLCMLLSFFQMHQHSDCLVFFR
jgi:hypothetical protein